MLQLTIPQLRDIVHGAAFLGSGGGGPVAAGLLIVERIDRYTQGSGVWCAAVPDVADDDHVCVVCDIGSANALVAHQDECAFNAIQRLQELLQVRFKFVVPAEIGAENSLTPTCVAARLGIPVVDADGAGRAVPALDMLTYAEAPKELLSIAPCVIASVGHQAVVLYDETPRLLERLIRPIIAIEPFTDCAGLALWATTGRVLKQVVIAGGLSRALNAGTALATARADGWRDRQLLNALRAENPVLLFSGTLAHITHAVDGIADFGNVTVQSGASEDSPSAIVVNQHENLAAWRSDRAAALGTAPDSLCWITADGRPFSNTEAPTLLGEEVMLVGIRARPAMQTPYMRNVCRALLSRLGYPGPLVQV